MSLRKRYYTLVREFGRPFRRRRMRVFAAFAGDSHVLDVGGHPMIWELCDTPRVTLLNIQAPHRWRPTERIDFVAGDGCEMPFRDGQYPVAFCNSVLEHLGSWERQQRMAAEIRRVGQRYWVQTPDRRFPVEPHLLAPLFHWLPLRIRHRLVFLTPWYLLVRPSRRRAYDHVEELCLLGEHELRLLFPDAEIRHERLAGISKSLIAVR